MPQDDAPLFARIAGDDTAGAREALAELYARHAGPVLTFLQRGLASTHDAEDLLHDTFLTAARRAATFRGEDARPWLLVLAANRLRDRHRRDLRRERRERVVRERQVEGPSAPAAAGLDAALLRLPAHLRGALELRFVQGLSHADVARALGVSLRTAKQRSADALARLRELLEGDR